MGETPKSPLKTASARPSGPAEADPVITVEYVDLDLFAMEPAERAPARPRIEVLKAHPASVPAAHPPAPRPAPPPPPEPVFIPQARPRKKKEALTAKEALRAKVQARAQKQARPARSAPVEEVEATAPSSPAEAPEPKVAEAVPTPARPTTRTTTKRAAARPAAPKPEEAETREPTPEPKRGLLQRFLGIFRKK
jgi:hypothetical protein